MAQIRHFGNAGSGSNRHNTVHKLAPRENPAAQPERYCAYNKTRERFVATAVDAVDGSPEGAEARLRTLAPSGEIGLWILPYVEISASSIRFPLDLVFLNQDCVVLGVAESFPLASLPAAGAKALSVLALPADTVAQGGMAVGDQLLISEPEEMKRQLRKMREAQTEAQSAPGPAVGQFAGKSAETQITQPGVGLASGAVEQKMPAPIQASPAKVAGEELPAVANAAPEEIERWKQGEPKGWFARLLKGKPVDPRKASREQIPGLIAYFFTGGTPVGYDVRDISSTGMYIVTDHRWYQDTVVRVTLTDRHSPSAARTVTVNAKAVRIAPDGVGFEFILGTEKRKKGELPPLAEQTLGMNEERIEIFLHRLRTAAARR